MSDDKTTLSNAFPEKNTIYFLINLYTNIIIFLVKILQAHTKYRIILMPKVRYGNFQQNTSDYDSFTHST